MVSDSHLSWVRKYPPNAKRTGNGGDDQRADDAEESFHYFPPWLAICVEAAHAHLLEQPMQVGKKCKGARFSAPGA